MSSFVAGRNFVSDKDVCLLLWTVRDGAEFEGKENSDEPIHYGRRKSFVFLTN